MFDKPVPDEIAISCRLVAAAVFVLAGALKMMLRLAR
jgi:hypothetical protein